MAQGGSGGIRQFIGLTGEEEVRRAFKSLGQVGEQAFKDISRAAQASAGNVGQFGRSVTTAEAGVSSLSRTLSGLSAFKGGIAALLGTAGVREALDSVSDSLQKFRDVRNTAFSTGLGVDTVKAFNLAMTKAGASSEKTGGALIQFGSTAGDIFANWKKTNKELLEGQGHLVMVGGAANKAAESMTVLKGGMSGASDGLVKVIRGAEKLDESRDVFANIDIDIGKFVNAAGKLDTGKLFEATIKRLDVLLEKKDALAVRTGALLLGEDDVTKLSQGVRLLAQNYAEIKKEAQNLPPTAGDLSNLEKYDLAAAGLRTRWTAIKDSIAAASLGLDTDLARGTDRALAGFQSLFAEAAKGFENLGPAANQAFAEFGETSGITGFFTKLWTDFTAQGGESFLALQPTIDAFSAYLATALKDPWTAFSDIASGVWERMEAAAKSVLDWIGDKLSAIASIASSIGSAIGSVLGNIPMVPGLAAGGIVRGPGTGTSDSVLARLSAGEFVMKTKAVDHWGPQFMHALNSLRNPFGFAEGGLVGLGASLMPASGARFAEGGLAAAETGTPVHLHFPSGGQVQLRGDRAVTEALLREARRAQMLSGGRRPGTFAAA